MVDIAVATSDFRLVSRLLSEGARRGLSVIHVVHPSEIPLTVKVLIMKRGEMVWESVKIPTIYADDFTSPTSVLDRAMEIAAGKADSRAATISIDPGRRVGVAFIVDEYVIRTESFTDIVNLERSIREFIENHKMLETDVIIGSGAPEYREAVLELIRRIPSLSQAPVKIVPEEGTSKIGLMARRRRGSDEYAASTLAMRRKYVKHKP
jgi:hypothetical protein